MYLDLAINLGFTDVTTVWVLCFVAAHFWGYIFMGKVYGKSAIFIDVDHNVAV